MSWVFQSPSPMGGATGEAFSNVLHSTGMNSSEVLAREAIQNSVDAGIRNGDSKVRVAFRHRTIVGNDKGRFISNFELTALSQRKEVLDLPPDHCLNLLDDPEVPIAALYIEDYGTHGLSGNPHSSRSHFFRLLLSLGDSTKARETDSTGGSYGYGKAVYSASSRIHTIVAYSVFNPTNDDDTSHARLMGCSYFSSHTYNGEEFTGRAWFGLPDSSDGQIVHPFQDELAHKLAERLGFERRDPETTGTSILIIDCPIDIDEVRASTEKWWWPRILEDDLDVELWDDGDRQSPPRPRSREDLKPYIHCFEMAIGRTEPTGDHDKSQEFVPLPGVRLGSYGFTLVEEEDNIESDANDEMLVNRVAMIRSPRMVVQYMEPGRLSLSFAGVFVAATDVDHALKMSEPPAHDRWTPKSTRFQNYDQRVQVETILRRLKQQLRRFVGSAVPPSPNAEARIDRLERMLGQLFKPPTTKNGGKGGAQFDPIEITFDGPPEVISLDGGLRTIGGFRVGLKPEADRDEAMVSVRVDCFAVEDGGVSRDDPISVLLLSEQIETFDPDQSGSNPVTFTLDKTGKAKFTFETDTYHSDWTTSVSVQVQEEGRSTDAE